MIPIDAIGEAIFVLDEDGVVSAANPAAEKLTGVPAAGLSAGELADRLGFHLADGRLPETVEISVRLALEGGEPPPLRGTITADDGSAIDVLFVTSPIREDGRIIGALSIWHDMTGRQQLRSELAESEAKYRNLVELSPDAILIHQDGTIVFANPAAISLLGVARQDDLVGQPVLEIVHPGTREHVEWNIEVDLRGEESPLTAVDLLCPDGTIVTVQGRGAMIPFGGRPAVQVVLRDVTEEKRAEAALRENEERLRMAKACAGIGIWEWLPPGATGAGSPDCIRLDDDSVPDVGRIDDWRSMIYPPDREQVEAQLAAVVATGESFEVEFRFDLGWEAPRWMRLLGGGVFDEAGRLVRILGVYMDITDQKRAEEALREREQTLQGIFRAAPVGIGMVSDRTITMINDQLCRITGYSRDELVGQDARLLYPDDEAYECAGKEKYARIAETGTGVVETRWRRRDGSVLDILLSSSPIDLARPHENVIFNALDISRLRESERALASYMDDLQRSNEELQRFAYVASHDLQEPLRSIVSFSQLLERRYRGKLDSDADEFIAFIVEGGNRMQRLIEDLLQLSRVETTAKPLAPTDAGEVVADALRLMETPIREAGATVIVGELPRVMADAAQLAQVFTNLVGNALKYRRPDRPAEIRISAEQAGGLWRFAVADNGIGIEAEYYDRIFVIFQRLHTRDEFEGTGIGLAVARKIVERHGGRIWVESTPGEGSTFLFTLRAV
ncbi:MAG: PAS domain S-box protein [Methanospirillum sp.]